MKTPATRFILATGVLLSLVGCSLVQAAVSPPPPIYDFIVIEPTRPSDAPQPTLVAKVESVSTPRPSAAPARTQSPVGRSAKGVATYYCCTHGYPSGAYAAAGPELRIGKWRGRYVRVCGSVCIRVRLVDWCGCPSNHIIDLYPEMFRKLAPLSRGIVRVTVSW